ncbi:hypothetical protein [Sphingomonas sp. 37zxx]|uniref:hypothetical protein n=1 Tax=Sphingomonas sp. 37zxx TaxID=1550073 RepID=UPI00053BEB00|nr:hypothetical protein [Sphingomonas sp. 37zxx]
MSSRSETDYFAQRERQELARADRCSDIAARLAHLGMAKRYHARVEVAPMVAAPPTSGSSAS